MAELLFEQGYRFDFLQAVRLLEAAYPDAVGVGEGSDPEREPVRFESAIRLDFAASDLDQVDPPAAAGAPARMRVNFFGLAGGEGPLPAPFVESIQERMRARDFGIRDFLDIFNHRLLSLMFRGAKAHRPALAGGEPGQSAVAGFLRAFAGIAQPGLRDRLAVPDSALLHYSGLLSQRLRSAAGLECMLTDYFQMPFAVRQMAGGWRSLPPEETTAIGAHGRNRQLGGGAALGSRVWDQSGGIEIVAGPLSLAQFTELLPGGKAQAGLRDLARFYGGTSLEYFLRLVLKGREKPAARLGQACLGWTSWLQGGSGATDDAQVRIALAV